MKETISITITPACLPDSRPAGEDKTTSDMTQISRYVETTERDNTRPHAMPQQVAISKWNGKACCERPLMQPPITWLAMRPRWQSAPFVGGSPHSRTGIQITVLQTRPRHPWYVKFSRASVPFTLLQKSAHDPLRSKSSRESLLYQSKISAAHPTDQFPVGVNDRVSNSRDHADSHFENPTVARPWLAHHQRRDLSR